MTQKEQSSSSLRQVLAILTFEERRQLGMLTPLVVMTALLETAGVASIVPFLALLSDPLVVTTNPAARFIYKSLGFGSTQQFFFAVGVGVLLLLTVGNTVSAVTNWLLLRFSWMRGHTLSSRLLRGYLRQPYEYFLSHNSADLGKNILAEVQSVVTGVIVQAVQLVARLVVVVLVSLSLFLIDPFMALGIITVFGGVYGGIYFGVRRHVTLTGRERTVVNQQRFKVAAESLAGVKELKLYGLEDVVVDQFQRPSKRFAELQASNAIVGQSPRYALETIAFGGVLIMVLHLLHSGRSLDQVLPVVGLYAFAAYRMLPGLQIIFAGVNALRFNLGALEILHRDLVSKEAGTPTPEPVAVPFARALALDGIGFTYAGVEVPTLRDVSLTIHPGEWVAFVGPTGAGKSTLIDLLLGLLEPTHGRMSADGMPLVDEAHRRGWQRHTAYVPQQIFLVDDTVAANICFGVAAANVDRERMMQAARVAQIAEFIETEMPDGYQTAIGERGVRLSGGQRQRLGIARALYRRPSLLVLDEATSALDNNTEARFFAALRAELANVAVVSIAHRLSTTRDFHRIFVLERGRIVDEGTFNDLQERSPHFAVQEVA